MNLEKTVEQELKKIVDSGDLEKLIQENIKETIAKITRQSLSSYSAFGKDLEEKISKSFCLDLSRITIQEYNTMMLSYITDEIDFYMKSEMKNIIAERIKKFFQPLEKKEYNISEIVEEFKDYAKQKKAIELGEDYLREGFDITCHVLTDHSVGYDDNYIDLYLDIKADKRKYACEWGIRMKKNEGFWHIDTPDGELHKARNKIMGGFEKLLFQMYSQRVNIICDKSDYDTYVYSDTDED